MPTRSTHGDGTGLTPFAPRFPAIAPRPLQPERPSRGSSCAPSTSRWRPIGIVVTAPVMLVIAVVVKLTSPGPGHLQADAASASTAGVRDLAIRRFGASTTSAAFPFAIYKFRTMRVGVRHRTGVGEPGRPPGHAGGPRAAQVPARRAAAAVQRAARRHERGGTAPRAAEAVRRSAREDRPLSGAPAGAARDHRLGPDQPARTTTASTTCARSSTAISSTSSGVPRSRTSGSWCARFP